VLFWSQHSFHGIWHQTFVIHPREVPMPDNLPTCHEEWFLPQRPSCLRSRRLIPHGYITFQCSLKCCTKTRLSAGDCYVNIERITPIFRSLLTPRVLVSFVFVAHCVPRPYCHVASRVESKRMWAILRAQIVAALKSAYRSLSWALFLTATRDASSMRLAHRSVHRPFFHVLQ
jgi:hypothetical protein